MNVENDSSDISTSIKQESAGERDRGGGGVRGDGREGGNREREPSDQNFTSDERQKSPTGATD